jgi:cytochrome P450
MTIISTDLLGRPLSEQEQELLHIYQALKELAARQDLPPCAARNVRRALAAMWQVTNDLDLQFEQLFELGV